MFYTWALLGSFLRQKQNSVSGYRQLIDEDPGFEERRPLYRAYHQLNHFNLFGGWDAPIVRWEKNGIIIHLKKDIYPLVIQDGWENPGTQKRLFWLGKSLTHGGFSAS